MRIINAQTFLFLKFLENEVRINKDLNLQNYTTNKIVIMVDEAHLIIDKNNPVALNFIYQMVKRIRKYFGAIIITTQNVNDCVGDETIKKYSTAIINNCQYSMVFKLNPGDISDLNSLG
jgi:type IV secretory pathway VirB4 component